MSTGTRIARIAMTAAVILGTASAAPGKGFVVPCSLDGVNPDRHHRIFRHLGIAREYGFVESAAGIWYVQASCRR
jgi:hypothetical protein